MQPRCLAGPSGWLGREGRGPPTSPAPALLLPSDAPRQPGPQPPPIDARSRFTPRHSIGARVPRPVSPSNSQHSPQSRCTAPGCVASPAPGMQQREEQAPSPGCRSKPRVKRLMHMASAPWEPSAVPATCAVAARFLFLRQASGEALGACRQASSAARQGCSLQIRLPRLQGRLQGRPRLTRPLPVRHGGGMCPALAGTPRLPACCSLASLALAEPSATTLGGQEPRLCLPVPTLHLPKEGAFCCHELCSQEDRASPLQPAGPEPPCRPHPLASGKPTGEARGPRPGRKTGAWNCS